MSSFAELSLQLMRIGTAHGPHSRWHDLRTVSNEDAWLEAKADFVTIA
jgi:hypothetical protein